VRVAVTGSGGRLGRALLAALGEAPFAGPAGPIGWDLPVLDLDAPGEIAALLDRERPEAVVHTAAWTDVDGCARDPELARRRNGLATGVIAAACAARGLDLVVVSTNEVFDGERTDGLGYAAGDPPNPINPYGASKLAGEIAAMDAYEAATGVRIGAVEGRSSAPVRPQLAIVRTAWLFGPPGADFPAKIVAAAERARAAGEALRVVGDEIGNPTSTGDLAEAIVELLGSGAPEGIHHCVNEGAVSRAGWARELLRRMALDVVIDEVPASTWERPSRPPLWGALAATPLPSGEAMRPWTEALADDLPWRLRDRAGAPR
jgi:dTDP-4-dehydrorhamnose reductase